MFIYGKGDWELKVRCSKFIRGQKICCHMEAKEELGMSAVYHPRQKQPQRRSTVVNGDAVGVGVGVGDVDDGSAGEGGGGRDGDPDPQQIDLLSLFIDHNPKITDVELRDITVNFIIAGKDTTAQMLSWFFYHLTTFADTDDMIAVNAGIRAEITEVFGGCDEEHTQSLSYADVNTRCHYIECCLMESLRLYPPVPHLIRTAIKDIPVVTNRQRVIQKGDEVLVAVHAMARLPSVWRDPLRFDPSRFTDHQHHDPWKYPAFNLQPRLCLGKHVALLEGKVAIIKLFSRYKKIERYCNQPATPGEMIAPTNQMPNGFKVIFTK